MILRSSPAMILISNKQIKNAHNKKDLLSKGSFFIMRLLAYVLYGRNGYE